MLIEGAEEKREMGEFCMEMKGEVSRQCSGRIVCVCMCVCVHTIGCPYCVFPLVSLSLSAKRLYAPCVCLLLPSQGVCLCILRIHSSTAMVYCKYSSVE